MNQKRYRILNGSLLSALKTGERALIQSQGRFVSTSAVVAIHSLAPNRVRFETLNTHYTLLPDNVPQAAEPACAAYLAA